MHWLTVSSLAAGLLASAAAMAAEQTVTLAVENMYCAACPFIVSKTLERVDGVRGVAVSDASKTATVTFDDARATVADLIQATSDAGYPSARK